MERNLKYAVFVEDGAFIARCLDVEVTSEGDKREEAIANLQEALELYFETTSPDAQTLMSANGMRYAYMDMPEIIAEWAQDLGVGFDDDEQIAVAIGASPEAIARWKKLESRPTPSMLEQHRRFVAEMKEHLASNSAADQFTTNVLTIVG